MREEIRSEFRRMLDLLPEVDPTTEEYHTLLNSMEHLGMVQEFLEGVIEELDGGQIIKVEYIPVSEQVCNGDCAGCDDCKSGAEEALEVTGVEPEEPEQQTEEVAEEAQVSEEPAKTYDMVDVRKALIDARNRGVDIKAVLKTYAATNMTNLKPEFYAEVMAKLEEL